MQPFIHLHTHSQYSILDGQASIKALVDKAIGNGMRGLAITDHGNMFGIKEFHDYCNKKNGDAMKAIKGLKKDLEAAEAEETPDNEKIEKIKADIKAAKDTLFIPIFGCEMYVAEDKLTEHVSTKDKGYHLIVLAKNYHGYKNLIKLVSKAWTDGFYHHPRTDKYELEKYHEDLMVCSACLGGEIPKLITNDNVAKAKEVALWFKGVFGDDFYLELQRHKATVPRANHEAYPMQQKVNNVLIEMSKELGIKLVCTNDVHFVNEDDAEAHDRLICVSTGRKVNDPDRMLYSKQEWMKTQEEMNEVFADCPEALSNTLELLEKTEIYSIEHGPILPNFPLPEPFTDNNEYLRYLVYEGAKKRWPDLDDEHKERLDFELDTIKNMGFPGYFLIVQDFIQAARDIGVSVGPGRGSAAGSAVAYSLGITQIDPIKYDLLFERFLNPDRISLPDIDIDFDDDGRARVLKYVTEKYGAEKVAHIITYGSMAAKMAIKDVARVEDLPIPESDRLAKMIPSKPNDMPNDEKGKPKKITIKNCLDSFKEFAAEQSNPNKLVRETIQFAEKLEGNVRGTGVHACGVIIGRDDITDWVPVSTAPDKDGTKMLVTQYEGSVIESTGLIKMDFLGLKTLSIIKDAIANIKVTHGLEVDIDNIPLDDPKTYQLYCEGRTTGTFQFESPGMQKYLIELQPTTFEDLIAMNALYRPGPMQYIPDFIKRKHGEQEIVYDIPVMEQYLKDTYGVTVYQEQVMLLSRLLAGFTRGQSDGLRKAMGKKLIAKMNELKVLFLEGGKERGHKEDVLNKIWKDWENFASYAFNKSHATCYSWVAFQTAYLKANYPSEYMAAVLSRAGDMDKAIKFMDECKAMKIEIKGPDVNESYNSFSANKAGDIRFGLSGVKGVGVNAVEAIIKERDEHGPYKDIYDFVERINLSACNRKTIETLALAGAFDSFEGISREDILELNKNGETFADTLVKYGQRVQLDKQSQVMSLFGGTEEVATAKPQPPHAEKWNHLELLRREKELVGMYLSAHPLDPYYLELRFGCNSTLKELNEKQDLIDQDLTFGGLVVSFTQKTSKKGNPFGILKLEDYTGSFEIMLFGENLLTFERYGKEGTAVYAKGAYQRSKFGGDRVNFNVKSFQLLSDMKGKLINNIEISLHDSDINENIVEGLHSFIGSSQENLCDLYFKVKDSQTNNTIQLRSEMKMPLTKHFIDYLDGEEIEYKVNVR